MAVEYHPVNITENGGNGDAHDEDGVVQINGTSRGGPLLPDDLEQRSNSDQNYPHIRLSIKFMVLASGISSLLPWYMVINAAGFFRIRLKATYFKDSFANFLQLNGIIFGVIGGLLAIFLARKISYRFLVLGANGVLGVLICVICVLSSLNTNTWALEFFIICLLVMVFIAFCHTTLNSSAIAIFSMVAPQLTIWFYTGKGLAGLVAVAITVATVSFPSLDMNTAAVWFFLVATIYVLPIVTTITYKFIMSPEIKNVAANKRSSDGDGDSQHAPEDADMSTLAILKSGWLMCLLAFLIRLTTFTIYPALVTNIREFSPDETSDWSTKYFQLISVFLPYAVGDLIGKMLPKGITFPNRRHLTPCVLLRLVLVPVILMCNIQPRTIPVWFKHVAMASCVVFLTGLTEGWFLNRVIMCAPSYVKGKSNKAKLGMFVYQAYLLGMLSSVAAIFTLSKLINI